MDWRLIVGFGLVFYWCGFFGYHLATVPLRSRRVRAFVYCYNRALRYVISVTLIFLVVALVYGYLPAGLSVWYAMAVIGLILGGVRRVRGYPHRRDMPYIAVKLGEQRLIALKVPRDEWPDVLKCYYTAVGDYIYFGDDNWTDPGNTQQHLFHFHQMLGRSPFDMSPKEVDAAYSSYMGIPNRLLHLERAV